jgi:hypothetical protein
MSTYRERREARAERLRGWAEKREVRAEAQLTSQTELRHDWAFITQPGHIPARARMNAADDRACESLRKAESMNSRAAGIEAQLAGAIYSDDENAIEALQARIAALEVERDRIKAYNATCRKGAQDLSILTEAEKRSLLGVLRYAPYQCKGGAFPSYHLSNLSANINRNRKRLEQLLQEASDS